MLLESPKLVTESYLREPDKVTEREAASKKDRFFFVSLNSISVSPESFLRVRYVATIDQCCERAAVTAARLGLERDDPNASRVLRTTLSLALSLSPNSTRKE